MPNKNKVFMVAYQFPPMGGSGVQRSAKFAKYLTSLNYDVTVLTIEVDTAVMDESLTKELEGVNIIRTKAHDLTALPGPFGLAGKVIQRKIMMPDGEIYWAKRVQKEVLNHIKDINPDIFYTTSYPYSDHLIGLYVKNHMPDLKWVVDFRDEWTKNPYIIDMNRSNWRMNKEAKMEQDVVEGCDHLITNSPQMLQGFMEDYDIKDKSTVIPNGYDPYDFEGLKKPVGKSEVLTFAYAGSMYGRRSPELFLRSLQLLIDEGLIDPSLVKVNLVGHFLEKDKDKAFEWLKQKELLSFSPYLPHKESIQFLLDSEVLLLIVGPGVGAKNFYTGKIFEYIYCKKPIFAIVPEDGAAAGVIRETDTGFVAESSSLEAVKKTLADIFTHWQEETMPLEYNEEAISGYNRYKQTKDLADVFEKVIK